jgi:prominin 1
MMGVGFSFIFGWLLMILVIVTFVVGSPIERYGCQPLQSPYIGLQFADRVLNATTLTSIAVGNQTIEISVYNTIIACEKNQGIYTALNLESIYNATEIVNNVTSSLDVYKQDLANLTVDLSSIVIYSQSIENSLNSLTTMGLATVTVNTSSITSGLNTASTSLTDYATQLNTSAASITDLTIRSIVEAYSYNFTIVDATYIPPLTNAVPDLDSSLANLQTISGSLNTTVDTTKTTLQNTDAAVQANGSALVTNQVTTFSDNIFADVNNYTSWLLIQLQDNVGACRPVFDAYSDAVNLLCSYAIDTLSGLWFSLGWAVFFLIPAAICGMKLAKFYRQYKNGEYESDNGNIVVPGGKPQKGRLRSARIHPSEYY